MVVPSGRFSATLLRMPWQKSVFSLMMAIFLNPACLKNAPNALPFRASLGYVRKRPFNRKKS
jgi:hypothetical protein